MKNLRLLVVLALMTMSSSLFAFFNIRITNKSTNTINCAVITKSSTNTQTIQENSNYLYQIRETANSIVCTYEDKDGYTHVIKNTSDITPESQFAFYDDKNNPRLIRTDPPETGKQK